MFQLTLAGWKYDELSAKVLRNKKIMSQALSIILGYLVCWSWYAYFLKAKRSSDYSKSPWSYNLGENHEKWNSKPTPPPPPSQIMKPHHFPILVWNGGGINFTSISDKHRRQPGGILNIKSSILRDDIPAPDSSVPRTLVKAKIRWQTSEGQRDL